MPDIAIAPLAAAPATTTTDQVFDTLYRAVISLDLPPGGKLSEAEISKQLGVSRQPVRDAFFRLSKLGFLLIRPQRATLVSKISETAVLQATFVRTALEVACTRAAAQAASPADIADLRAVLDDQAKTVAQNDRAAFHDLDEKLHRRICEIAGHSYVWALIQEQKAHMDRVRILSLSLGQQTAYDEHVGLVAALAEHDADLAERLMQAHLQRIHRILPQIRAANAQYFEDTPTRTMPDA